MLGPLVALVAALCWSGLDAARKQLTGRLSPLSLNAWLALAPLPVFGAWAAIAGWRLTPDWLVVGPIALALGGLGDLLFLYAIRRASLSTVVPTLALTPVLALGLGALINAEIPTAAQFAGGGLVIAGGVQLGRVLRRQRHERAEIRGVLLMLAVALVWSLNATVDKAALATANVPTHAVLRAIGVGAVSLAIALRVAGPSTFGRARSAARPLLAACLLAAACQGLQLVAFDLTYVGVVEAIKRAVGVLGALAFGRWVFGEAVGVDKLLAAGLMASGAVLATVGG